MFFQKAFWGRNRWWRWLLVLTGLMAAITLASVPSVVFEGWEAERLGVGTDNIAQITGHPDFNRTVYLALMLLSFAFALLALALLIRLFHRKTLLSVVTGRPRFDWSRLWVGMVIWFVILAASVFLFMPSSAYEFSYDASRFWPQLLVILLLIPIQASSEEVFFRGYLTQGAALIVRNKLVTFLIIVLAFTAVHAANPEFYSDYTRGIISYLLMSAFLGAIAILDDGIELSCGVHIANNIFASAIFSARDGSFVVDSLFHTDIAALNSLPIALDVATYAVGFAVLFLIYKWRWSTFVEPIRPAPTLAEADAPAGERVEIAP